jgi:hypothetical protein
VSANGNGKGHFWKRKKEPEAEKEAFKI